MENDEIECGNLKIAENAKNIIFGKSFLSFMMNFFSSLRAYGQAAVILFSRRFIGFLVFPVVISVLLYIGGEFLVSSLGDSVYRLLEEYIISKIEGIPGLGWFHIFTRYVIKIGFHIAYFFFFISFGGYLVLIVMSPIYSWLSERTETFLSGRKYPFRFRRFMWEISRGIMIAVRNAVVQFLISVTCLLWSFVPVLGWLSPFALFISSAYFYGFSFIDYAIERKHLDVKESVRYVNRNFWQVTAIGSVFTLSLMIPGYHLIACCFVSLLSVIAGTIVIYRQEAKLNIEFPPKEAKEGTDRMGEEKLLKM